MKMLRQKRQDKLENNCSIRCNLSADMHELAWLGFECTSWFLYLSNGLRLSGIIKVIFKLIMTYVKDILFRKTLSLMMKIQNDKSERSHKKILNKGVQRGIGRKVTWFAITADSEWVQKIIRNILLRRGKRYLIR